MNRFTIGLLLLFVGLLVLAGGVWMVAYPWVDTAEWEFMHIVRNCLFGVFFVIAAEWVLLIWKIGGSSTKSASRA